MMRSALRFGLCLGLGLVLASTTGCAKKPTMKVNHADIGGFAMGLPPSVILNVVMDVYNPNSYDVAIRALRGQVVMAERFNVLVDYRAPGNGLWLPAGKTTPVTTPIAIPMDVALALVGQAYAAPTIPFRLTGKADVVASSTLQIEKDDYSVDETGSITRAQFEAILPNTFRR